MMFSSEHLARLAQFGLEHAGEGILCSDPEGRLLYVNPSAARTLARTADALKAATIFDISPDMNTALWKELWKEIRAHGQFAFEFALRGVENRVVTVDMTAHLLTIGTEELACVYFRDVEERKRLQKLQQEFVSTVSHELRSPMTVIREGISQVFEGLRGDINEGQRRALEIALSGIDRLCRIIDELLDLSKIESGKVKLRLERLDVAALAREVSAGFQSMADERGLELRVTTPAGPVLIYADRDRMIQVWTNLMGNAFKFTERGYIQTTVSARDREVECSVSDSGVGLAEGEADTVFDKFEQLDRPAVTGEKGTGLGLSISRGIVELHKGRIRAESAGTGQGTRFVFVLPRSSGREVFQEQLVSTLEEIGRRGGSLSVVYFQINGASRARVTSTEISAALDNLENLIRQTAGRRSDLVVKDETALYWALTSTVKREASRAAERVMEAFSGLMPMKTRIITRIHSYPEEGSQENAFIRNVFEKEAA